MADRMNHLTDDNLKVSLTKSRAQRIFPGYFMDIAWLRR
jgi:hypothetical protein